MNCIVFKHLTVPVLEGKEEEFITALDKFLNEHSSDKTQISHTWDVVDM